VGPQLIRVPGLWEVSLQKDKFWYLLLVESWALRCSHITKLEVFWHRSIRRILKIGIMQVKEERITNKRIRIIFHNIPSAENKQYRQHSI
jgi:hypothetical protein